MDTNSLQYYVSAFTYTNFYLTKFEDCDPQNRSKLSYRLYVKDSFQYVDFDIVLPVELDNRVGGRFVVESTVNERQYTQLFSSYEKNYCLALQTFGGEFWYDFQRSMQLNPGSCPIPKCIDAFTHTNFLITRTENCDPLNVTKLSVRFYINDGYQYCNYNCTVPVALDDNVGVEVKIESTINEKQYVELFTMKDKHFCTFTNKYAGQFWYDMQRSMQVMPGSCPVPKRRYQVRNHKLDYSRISLQTFPFGKLRLSIKLSENVNANLILCIRMIIENNRN
ncbi:hypothetical protein FQR65_LT02168 [Abscondita terminalis]|nr:hypothetical protein FQR65_LT02168 [Abscondita terminalis]